MAEAILTRGTAEYGIGGYKAYATNERLSTIS
jgi:hypothetical protein